jgi:hypothetical protein
MVEPGDFVKTKAEDDGMDPSGVSSYTPTGARTGDDDADAAPGLAGDGSAGDPEREAEHPPPPAEPGGGAPAPEGPPTRPPTDS